MLFRGVSSSNYPKKFKICPFLVIPQENMPSKVCLDYIGKNFPIEKFYSLVKILRSYPDTSVALTQRFYM